MRKFFVTVGLPGSGKSTFLKDNNLEGFVICKDTLRTTFFGLDVDDDFKLGIIQQDRGLLKELELKAIYNKMKTGQTIIIDSTCAFENILSRYEKIAKNSFYEFIIIDFTSVPKEVCLERNSIRQSYKKVPEVVIDKMYESLQEIDLSKYSKTIIDYKDFSYREICQDILTNSIVESADYDNVFVIGDIQGCFYPLNEFYRNYNNQKENNLFIFTGDFTDRGIENDQVLKFLYRKRNFPNFKFVMGNHEHYMMNYLSDVNHTNYKPFEEKTIPQIEKLDKNILKEFYHKMQDFLLLQVNDKEYFISHGGNFIKDVHLNVLSIPSSHFWYGHKGYDFDIDSFSEEHTHGIIHGHRNVFKNPIKNGNFYNLEGKVEYGGNLRVLRIIPKTNSFEELYFKNEVFDENLEEHEFYKNKGK